MQHYYKEMREKSCFALDSLVSGYVYGTLQQTDVSELTSIGIVNDDSLSASSTNEIVKLLWIAFFPPHHTHRCTKQGDHSQQQHPPAAFMAYIRNEIQLHLSPYLLQPPRRRNLHTVVVCLTSRGDSFIFFYIFDAQSAKGKNNGNDV